VSDSPPDDRRSLPRAAPYGAQLLVGLGFHQNTTSHVWAAVEAAMLKV